MHSNFLAIAPYSNRGKRGIRGQVMLKDEFHPIMALISKLNFF